MTASVTVLAHAKLNLFLRIFGKDDTGYHGLETLFCLLDLADEITVHPTDSGISLDVAGEGTGPVVQNLAYRAAVALLDTVANPIGVRIELHKKIPVGAGLGGGSSDAAATLHAVNALLRNRVPSHELLQIGARLGSDVPFLVTGAPMALAWNRGERLFRVPAPEQRPVLLVFPGYGVSTAQAYGLLDRSGDGSGRGAVMLEAGSFADWGSIARLGGNDFEAVVFGKHPDLKERFFRLAATRPLIARMSGSGATLFGVYRNEREAADARDQLTGPGSVLLTATRTAPPLPPESR